MKLKLFSIFFAAVCIMSFDSGAFGASKQTSPSPSVFVSESRYTFPTVIDGTEVTHDFIIQNKGGAPLAIEKVKTGWGCTAVSYPRQIPPGGEGKIVIKVDTAGYGGKTLTKKITVKTNSLKHSVLYLTIMGNVEQFVDIVPKRVVLRGFAGNPIKAKVKIIPKDKYPFTIKKAKTTNTKNIAFTLDETKSSEKMEYVLTVENLKKTKGRYADAIKLKTDSKIRPEIKIYVIGNILDRPKNEKQ